MRSVCPISIACSGDVVRVVYFCDRVPDFDACSIFIYACSGDVVRVVYFCDRVVYFFARVVYLRRVCSIHARVPDSIPRPDSE